MNTIFTCFILITALFHPLPETALWEILMYDLEDGVKHIFNDSTSAQEIRRKLNLHNFFKNGSIDDYLFQPKGYSLNGIDGKDLYYTVHATPQEPGFYVSFETNVRDKPRSKSGRGGYRGI